MSLTDWIRKVTPDSWLKWNRLRKKHERNSQLSSQALSGKSISQQDLEKDFRNAGIVKGDVVLVHSSLSRIGHLKDGPKTFVDALINVVGDSGTILMPTSPNSIYQLDFIRKHKTFDVVNTPSKTGKITEYFRTLPGVKRSLHPTEPVSAIGTDVDYFLDEHFGELTPYTSKSPFYKISEKGGKILYVGVTLEMAGTNLHTLEDAVDFKFPVYYNEIFNVEVIDEKGKRHQVKTKVHDPVYSKKRKCDELNPMFIQQGALKKVKIGEAETLVADAKKFFDVMVKNYNEKGVTMYTPKGEK